MFGRTQAEQTHRQTCRAESTRAAGGERNQQHGANLAIPGHRPIRLVQVRWRRWSKIRRQARCALNATKHQHKRHQPRPHHIPAHHARRPPPASRYVPHHWPVGGRACPRGTALRCTVRGSYLVFSDQEFLHIAPVHLFLCLFGKCRKDEQARLPPPPRRPAQRARTCRKEAYQQFDVLCTGQPCQQYAQCHLLATCCGGGFTSSTPHAGAGSNGATEGAF